MHRLGAKHGRNSSPHDYARVLSVREEFRTYGALRGRIGAPDSYDPPHSLKHDTAWRDFINDVAASGAPVYTVWSYTAPIAFCVGLNTGPQWYVPPVKYSVTTSAHQDKIRAALTVSAAGDDALGYRTLPGLHEGEQFEKVPDVPRCSFCQDGRRARVHVLLCWNRIGADGNYSDREQAERDLCDKCMVSKRYEFQSARAWCDFAKSNPYFTILKRY